MRIRAIFAAILAMVLAGCTGWASEQPLIPSAERDRVGLSGIYQSDTDFVRISSAADAIYLMEDADPTADPDDAQDEPTQVVFDFLRSRAPQDDEGKTDTESDYLLQARWVDDLGEVRYFYTIVTVAGAAGAPSRSFASFDMLCGKATRAFASREQDGFCIFDDYHKLRAAAFDALAWHDDARMEVGKTKYHRADPLVP